MTRWTVLEHIVGDAFCSKKSLSALLVHDPQALQKLCLSSHHPNPSGDYKGYIYIYIWTIVYIYIYIYIYI